MIYLNMKIWIESEEESYIIIIIQFLFTLKTKSKVSKDENVSEDVKGILTSDSDEPEEDEKMDVDNELERDTDM
jgi:hypothetical protein